MAPFSLVLPQKPTSTGLIIVAVLFFGGIWDWGVCHPLPRQKALVYAWPRGLEGRQTSQVPPLKQD